MNVNFPSSYPANTVSTGKPINVQTLQATFAAVLRSYGVESQTSTILEVIQPTSHANNPADDDHNQQRREHQQQIDRNDFTQFDRKLLDKSEIRHSEMISVYKERIEQHGTLRNDYQERIDQRELPPSTIPIKSSMPVTSSMDVAKPNELPPNRNYSPLQEQNVTEIASTNSQISSASSTVPNSTVVNDSVGLPMSMSGNVPTSMPVSAVPQIVPTQAFTLFTATGRFGQIQNTVDEKENEEDKEEQTEKKPKKKKQPFAMFEAIHTEAIRPSQRNLSRQSQKPLTKTAHRVAEKFREKPREVESEQSQNIKTIKTLEEFLNTSIQNVSMPKKGETDPPNQMQYLHRIAAACEAATPYAPIRMKLNLEHLGTLTLRFYFKSDKLMLRFETPTKESARFLHDHLDGLKAILSERKVQLASVEILQIASL